MPHEQMDVQQVAAYLHLDVREVVKLASRGQIPCRKVHGKFLFRKGDVEHWVEVRMHTLAPERLAKIEKGVSAHHGLDHKELLVCPLIPEGGLGVPLKGKTREATIRALVALAEEAGLVMARDELLQEIRRREALCSTAVIPGVAIPHPPRPLPYAIDRSFVVVGLTPSGIPYGAEDGTLTKLFFLICCKDERTHLHVLARLAWMLHEQSVLQAESTEQLNQLLQQREEAILLKAQ
jgi:PTS system nitrogen regulatory IIA component